MTERSTRSWSAAGTTVAATYLARGGLKVLVLARRGASHLARKSRMAAITSERCEKRKSL